jgi:diguanylate cyclase (GGDEF)-like protein
MNGAVEGQQDSVAPADEQTLSDREQTLAADDQTASDTDQTAADGDQAAADSDQAASDRDFEQGGDRGAHDESRELRDRNAQMRGQTAGRRHEAATSRDAIAHHRDLLALERDRQADRSDRELAARDAAWSISAHASTAAEILMRGAAERRRAAADRAAAADARARAAADRTQAAADRERAGRDRAQARTDREGLIQELVVAETDALTGARTRGAGLADLDQEINRARRTNARLVVGYVDVVGLKQVNDIGGHAAGDALLRRTVNGIRDHLRSYDLLIRVGGDEFVCVMSGATLEDAQRHFNAVQAALANAPEPCDIKVGFASFSGQENAEDLVARADADLPASPRSG